MNGNVIRLSGFFLAVLLMGTQHLTAQSTPEQDMTDVIRLNELANPNSDFYQDRAVFTVNGARAEVIESAARGVGIRGGYAEEARRINNSLMQRYRTRLSAAFDFAPLMLNDGYVVPPVITEIRQVRELSGPNYLYLSSGSYEIVREPRLTTITPTWMDWLLLPIREVRPPARRSENSRHVRTSYPRYGDPYGIPELLCAPPGK